MGYTVSPANSSDKVVLVAQSDIEYIKGEMTGFSELIFQTEREAAVKSVEDYIKNAENKGNEKFERAVAIYGILEPVKASAMIRDMKAKNLDNSKIQKLNLATLEKKEGPGDHGDTGFRDLRVKHRHKKRLRRGGA